MPIVQAMTKGSLEERNELTYIVFNRGGIQIRYKLANGFLCSILE
jgi:hypothetical protein